MRALRTGGLYRVVRHPLFLGESLLFAGAAAALGAGGAAAAPALLPVLAWCIQVEERPLAAEPGRPGRPRALAAAALRVVRLR